MALTLYGTALSRASRVIWMLEELGVTYTHVPTGFRGDNRSLDFLALNPNGRIPVLADDGLVLWESMAINLHLASRFPGPLTPRSPAEHSRATMWSFWGVTECERDATALLLHLDALPEGRRNPRYAGEAAARLARPLGVIDAHLATHGFLAEGRFGVADLNVASILAWSRADATLVARHPHLDAWLAAACARPAFGRMEAMQRRAAPPV
jgi:glutathione S-transferase